MSKKSNFHPCLLTGYEKDLKNHTRIEEKILFPKAKLLEKLVTTK